MVYTQQQLLLLARAVRLSVTTASCQSKTPGMLDLRIKPDLCAFVVILLVVFICCSKA